MTRSRLKERPGPRRKKGSKLRPLSRTGRKPSGYVKWINTPKGQRERIPVRPSPALVDPMKTLGHKPRGRKRR